MTEYLSSYWGIVANLLVFVVFGLLAYDKYARRWSARTGKYSVPGRITWSEKMPVGQKRALISYSYRVEGQLHNGEINPFLFGIDKALSEYPKGKVITVYYARKDPGFSRVDRPANHFDIIGSTVVIWLVIPVFFVNWGLAIFMHAFAGTNP